VKAVRNAIAASSELKQRSVVVFLHGSYKNNVNVRQNSDVDIGVRSDDVFFMDLPSGTTREHFGISDATYTYVQFKDEVGRALVNHFGAGSVQRGNKAFDIRENSYHVEADVAPFFEHRRYSSSGSYLKGVELAPDNGGRIINWPEQHYANGVGKNNNTSRAYKGVVRILKKMALEMEDAGIAGARGISGFLVECMVWNVPDQTFAQSTWRAVVCDAIAYLWTNTKNDHLCAEWGEVSELKYLFRGSPAKRSAAHNFLEAAWQYIT
jgi:hypothetical protein